MHEVDRSSIFKNPSYPYYSLVKEFQDVICHDPPSVVPPDGGVCHELTWFLEPNTALHGSGLYQGNNVASLRSFSVLSTRREWCGSVSLLIPHQRKS